MNSTSTPQAALPAGITHTIAWIDHNHASVVRLDAVGASPLRVRAHAHPTAQHGSEVRSTHEFFAQVCDAVEGVGAVLVTGGKTALSDFRHYAQKHRPQTAARIAAYEIIDHPTDNQLVARGRQFFEI